MELNVVEPEKILPIERAFAVSMVINVFKGRKNVAVHLYRPDVDPDSLGCDFDKITGDLLHPELTAGPESVRKIAAESFTRTERIALVDYLLARYGDKVSRIDAVPLEFPIPMGMLALSEIPEGKTIGVLRLEKTPNYPLEFPVHGFYDLAQHEPLVTDGE